MDHGPSQQSTFQLIKASSKLAISERVPFLNPNKDKIDSNCILGRVARFGSRIDTNEHVQKINENERTSPHFVHFKCQPSF